MGEGQTHQVFVVIWYGFIDWLIVQVVLNTWLIFFSFFLFFSVLFFFKFFRCESIYIWYRLSTVLLGTARQLFLPFWVSLIINPFTSTPWNKRQPPNLSLLRDQKRKKRKGPYPKNVGYIIVIIYPNDTYLFFFFLLILFLGNRKKLSLTNYQNTY